MKNIIQKIHVEPFIKIDHHFLHPFHPIIIDRRLHDMRLIAKQTAKTGIALDGQVIFSSGWEYGYWLNDMVTMRIAWNPHLEESDHEQALLKTLDDCSRSFIFDNSIRSQFNLLTVQAMLDQTKYLIFGKVNGTQPSNLYKRSGISLLEGWDTWSELNILADSWFGMKMETQPSKLQYHLMETSKHKSDSAGEELHKNLAKKVIQDAQLVVDHRIKNFRVRDPEVIIGWNFNPTAYRFGYLWQTKNLYFWWRDYGKVILKYELPCFMNVQDPVDIMIGEGIAEYMAEELRKVLDYLKFLDGIVDCLAAPIQEPKVPPFQAYNKY